MEEVIINGLFLIIATALPLYWGYKQKQKADKSLKESTHNRNILEMVVDFGKIGPVLNQVQTLCKDSEVDRVLLLLAHNGKEDPREVTVTWEYRQDENSIGKFKYDRIPTDLAYKLMLKEVVNKGCYIFTTEDEVPCILREFYIEEGVTQSKIDHVVSIDSGAGSTAIWFLSYATHAGVITERTRLLCDTLTYQLRQTMK